MFLENSPKDDDEKNDHPPSPHMSASMIQNLYLERVSDKLKTAMTYLQLTFRLGCHNISRLGCQDYSNTSPHFAVWTTSTAF